MKQYDLFDMKQARYSSFFTRIMIETIICITILLIVFVLRNINHELIGKINRYLQDDIQWQYVYDAFIQLKDILLH